MVSLSSLLKFKSDVAGAVTVDWVVLTAAIMLMGAVAVSIYRPGLEAGAGEINDAIVVVGGSLSPATT